MDHELNAGGDLLADYFVRHVNSALDNAGRETGSADCATPQPVAEQSARESGIIFRSRRIAAARTSFESCESMVSSFGEAVSEGKRLTIYY
jgi:hypothetical protein